MIKEYITEGRIVPMEVTIKLLENAMRAAMSSEAGQAKEAGAAGGNKAIPARRFLVDGFPRQMDQAVKFDETVRIVLSTSTPLSARLEQADVLKRADSALRRQAIDKCS